MKSTISAIAGLAALMQAGVSLAQDDSCGAELNYDDADIRAVVDEIAVRTGRTFLLDPRVTGRVTVKSPPNSRLCADEAWELFQAMLRVNGYAATPIGAMRYKIVPVQEAPRAAGPVGEGVGGDLVTEIVRLRYVDAREAAANLSQIINERGVAAPVRTGNAIILVDTADNVVRLKEVLARIDQDTTVYRTIPLNNAAASDVARVVSGLAQEMSEEGGVKTGQVSVVPVEASNSILIRAEPAMINRLSSVIAELDRIGEAKSDLSVVFLSHANAEELAPLLKEIANSQNGGASAASGDGQNYSTGASARRSRSTSRPTRLSSAATPTFSARCKMSFPSSISAASRCRSRRSSSRCRTRQRASLACNISSRVRKAAAFPSPRQISRARRRTSFGGRRRRCSMVKTVRSTATYLTATRWQGGAQLPAGLNGLALGGGGKTAGGTLFGAILTAIKQDTGSNVLSTPSVVTLDNQKATLSVGQEIPITTGEAVGDNLTNAFRTVSREEVGVILEVTPQINDGGTVTLEISQETSSIAGQIIDTSTDLITNKRLITTTALVDDGDILVIGGLVDETTESFQDAVPLLGDIPGVGNLFKTQGKSKTRRNLMVFIRPTILRDQDTARAATQKKLDYVRAKELLYTGQSKSDLDRLIEQVTGIDGAAPNGSGGNQ
ncbi:MAG: secretin N-terminal domain-containing protein [Parvularculaceae bacterium]